MATPNCELDCRQNRAMFSAIAKRYDLLNGLTSLGLDRVWRARLVRELRPQDHKTYLDLGAGTCKLEPLIHRTAANAGVIALDQCLPMLALGAGWPQSSGSAVRVNRDNKCRTCFVAGNALSLPLAANSFDGIVSAFCLRNFPDRRQAFAEVLRVLRPNGKVLLLDLSRPRGRVLGVLHAIYLRTWVSMLGRLLSNAGAYAYLRRSIQNFPPAQVIAGELRDAGLVQVQAVSLSAGIVTLWHAHKEPA